jgi:hypothetical protein
MITRRQFFISSINLTVGFYACTLSARVGPSSGILIGASELKHHAKYRAYDTVRDMLIHKIIGNSLEPGRVIPGHGWLYRRMKVREYIDKHYSEFGVLPSGEHNLGKPSSYPRSWIVDFDKIILEVRQDLARHDFSDYPDWVNV